MSDPLFEIVNVNISRNAPSVSQAGFGTAMILGPNATFANRTQSFSQGDLPALAALLCGGTSAPEYIAASTYFSQNPSPTQVVVGRQIASTLVITDNAGTFTAGAVKANVGGTVVVTNWGTSKDTTLTAFAAALQVAIRALVAGDTTSAVAYSSVAHTITCTLKTPGTVPISIDFSGVTGTTTAVIVSTANETITAALNAIVLVDNTWYGFAITSRVIADQQLAADWAESAPMNYFLCASNDTNIINTAVGSDTTSIAYYIANKAYVQSKVLYSGDQADYPEMAIFGAILWRNPGSYAVMFTTLSGIAVDALTSSQRDTALGKYAMTYEYIHGLNMVSETAASGLGYIDCSIFIDWLQAREAEAVFGVLSTKTTGMGKVPYTPAGIQGVSDAMNMPLKIAQNNGAIGEKEFDSNKNQIGGYYIITPTFSSIPSADKSSRTLNNMQFVAFYAGAIQKVQINGNVTL